MRTLFSYLSAIAAIALSLAVGKLIAHGIGILPASLWGMLTFALLLASGVLKEQWVEHAIGKLIFYMPLVFLPICIGVMQYRDLLIKDGWKLALVGIVAALISLAFIARVSQLLFNRSTPK